MPTWQPPSYRETVTVEGAMGTPDGTWRVEVVRRRASNTRWYRIVHDENVIDWLTIGRVQSILAEAGVDMATLTEVDAA